MVRVKICGITTPADARLAMECGADAIGLVFAKSPRQVSPARARSIVRSLGPWACAIGVFADQPPEEILKIAQDCSLAAIQLHGSESEWVLDCLKPWKIIKTIRVARRQDLNQLKYYDPDAFLFDTKAQGALGGTGETFEWNMLGRMKINKPFIVAGGLRADNVRKVVKCLIPYGVEASSGVEKRPGVKDAKLMREFIRRAKTV